MRTFVYFLDKTRNTVITLDPWVAAARLVVISFREVLILKATQNKDKSRIFGQYMHRRNLANKNGGRRGEAKSKMDVKLERWRRFI
jgi:hypothetical protein